jgi:ACT domain.
MLASVANAIARLGVNIEHLEVEERDHSMKALNLVIGVSNFDKLDEVLYEIKSLEFVRNVERA